MNKWCPLLLLRLQQDMWKYLSTYVCACAGSEYKYCKSQPIKRKTNRHVLSIGVFTFLHFWFFWHTGRKKIVEETFKQCFTHLVMWKYNCKPLWSLHELLCDNGQIPTRTHDSMINTHAHGHFEFYVRLMKTLSIQCKFVCRCMKLKIDNS